jgi:peptidoglycan/LPS O-acetylase OafA/YrhL
MKRNKLDSLILLRAIAVIAVCFCHFGYPLYAENSYNDLFVFFYDYGKYGVQIFFVVSGFVIPLSLYIARYSIEYYFRFLLKRLLRLHPPYLAALALTLLISFFSYKIRGIHYPETVESIIASLFYFHFPDDNPVFWTLAVEAEYYLFIGLLYNVIIKIPKVHVLLFTPVLILIGQSQLAEYVIFFSYIVYFLIGIIGFMIHTNQGSKVLNTITLIALLPLTYVSYGVTEALVASTTIGFILWYQGSIGKLANFAGEISYSFYLIHFPLGIKFINLLNPYFSPANKWVLFLLTILVTTLLAWIFYLAFEKPFAKLSTKIKYKSSTISYTVLESEV